MKNMRNGTQLAICLAFVLLLIMLTAGLGVRHLRGAGGASGIMVADAVRSEQQHSALVAGKQEAYIAARNAVFEARDKGNIVEARHLIENSMKPALDTYVVNVKNVLDSQKQQIDRSASSIESNFRRGSLLLIVMGAAAILLIVMAASFISRRLLR